jgi:hypothetical protein
MPHLILQEKQLSKATCSRAIAGQQQEKDVAFYLRRAFKDEKQIFVINDFSFSYNNENAQIDHLIIYRYGFILIESKSINGTVRINDEAEWSRTYSNKWVGMSSPIQQVELQQTLLKEYLQENCSEILPKLLGIMPLGFAQRCWHNICAVSSNSIIERNTMANELSEKIVKSEFVVDKVKELMKLKRNWFNAFATDTRPKFSDSDLTSITSFLLSSAKSKPKPKPEPKPEPKPKPLIRDTSTDIVNTKMSPEKSLLQCKKCGNSEGLIPNYGRYGYYINCEKCDTNTSMKMPCPQCHSKKTKVSKRKESYTLCCDDCGCVQQLNSALAQSTTNSIVV